MMWASILALLDGDDADRVVADAALVLGKAFEACVDGLIVRPDPRDAVRLAVDGMSPAMIESVIDAARGESERRIGRARATFNARCAEHGLEPDAEAEGPGPCARWHEEVAIAADRIAFHGRLADLVVVAPPAGKGDEDSDIAVETVLFETARPLLLAGTGAFRAVGGTALVAWNGSRESVHAVTAALPLLGRAARVVALGVDEEEESSRPRCEALCVYLARHGIAAEHAALSARGRPVARLLLEEAVERGADLLVMGAYGHSRLRELVLGGVTRQVLIEAVMPVLMAH
jgi:nucleotide-binding universal stress UspA family protein